jgi:hypothetical protein
LEEIDQVSVGAVEPGASDERIARPVSGAQQIIAALPVEQLASGISAQCVATLPPVKSSLSRAKSVLKQLCRIAAYTRLISRRFLM